jgi:hypothetical protein
MTKYVMFISYASERSFNIIGSIFVYDERTEL